MLAWPSLYRPLMLMSSTQQHITTLKLYTAVTFYDQQLTWERTSQEMTELSYSLHALGSSSRGTLIISKVSLKTVVPCMSPLTFLRHFSSMLAWMMVIALGSLLLSLSFPTNATISITYYNWVILILSFLSLKLCTGLLNPVGNSQYFNCEIQSTSQYQINLLFLSISHYSLKCIVYSNCAKWFTVLNCLPCYSYLFAYAHDFSC